MHQCSNILNEGLRPLDLRHLVYSTVSIDSFRSKMGEDQDVCVLSFRVKYREPAVDLMEFIEKGFKFVLDADVSSGENSDGEYYVFVEFPRVSKLHEFITSVLRSVSQLTGIKNWSFRYHKIRTDTKLTNESLAKYVPESPLKYNRQIKELRENSLKTFFNKSLIEDFSISDDDIITITKPYNRVYQFKLVSEDGKNVSVTEDDKLSEDDKKEIFWLTKVIGDYNINKVGENYLFKNKNRSIVLQRI